MNKRFHRVVLNAARGLRMVVQETARSAGKATGATRTAGAGSVAAMLAVSVASIASAQIVGAPNAPGHLRPTVLVAPNGVSVVNVQTPSAAGVSRNLFDRFDVERNGVVLNNSRTSAQTQLGGWVQGNPWLATGPARVILAEVTSGNPTLLRGFVEVGGQRAEVIVANPAGISVDGGGFINASRATLTTGAPQLDAQGGLERYLVRGGTVSIEGAGLDVRSTDYAAILARAVQVNAGIWANELKVVAGANDISADHGQVAPTVGAGPAPAFALDVSQLGGMYAGKITLIGTEAGLGVRNAGTIAAGVGELVVTASGRLENKGTLEGPGVQLASASDIDNRGGTIRQTGGGGLTVEAPSLSNTRGGEIGAEVAAGTPSQAGGGGEGPSPATGSGTTPELPVANDGPPNAGANANATPPARGSAPLAHPVPPSPPAPGRISAAGAILNDGGRIRASGPIALQTPQVDNSGGRLDVASLAASGAGFANAGGTLRVAGTFGAKVDRFDNTGGTLHAGALQIDVVGELINQDGKLVGDGGVMLTAGGVLNNVRGTVDAGADLAIQAGALTQAGGVLRSANDASIRVSGAMTNDGSITAGRNVGITAGTLQGGSAGVIGAGVRSDGSLGAAGNLSIMARQTLALQGTQQAAGDMTLEGGGVDLSGSKSGAANIAITATHGDVVTSGSDVVTPGTLSVAADALTNHAGVLRATGSGQLDVRIAGALDNSASGQMYAGGKATVRAGTLANETGSITAMADLAIAADGALGNREGLLGANGNLSITTGGAIDNTSGKLQAGGKLALASMGLFNIDGKAIAETLSIDTAGQALDNTRGTLTATKGADLKTGALTNSSGAIRSGGAMRIDTGSAIYDNAKGETLAVGDLSVRAGTIRNTAGLVRSLATTTLAPRAW